MNKLRCAAALILSLLASNALAETSSLTASVSGAELTIPSPDGYHEISKLSPEARNIAEQMTPETNRLLGVFVSESDLGLVMKGELPTFNRYMFLQSNKQLESYNIADQEFEQVTAEIKKQQKTMLANAKDDIAAQFEHSSKSLSEKYQTDLNLKAGEQIPLGVYLDKPNALGFAVLSKYRAEIAGRAEDLVVAGGTNFIRARNKLLYAYVYSAFDSQEDIDWVRETSRNWANSIVAASPSNAQSSRGSNPLDAIDWDEALGKGLAGGLAAGFLVLIIGIFRWFSGLFRGDK